MCANGGLNLTKFTSNKKDVLVNIPQEKNRKGVKNEDLMKQYIPEEEARVSTGTLTKMY